MDAFTVFSHGTIPQRAEKLQRHRYRLQAFHAAIGNHLAGRREILHYPLDNNSTSHERMLVAGQQTLHAVPPPTGIQTLTGIGDQSHLDWSAIIFSAGDWRTCVQLKPEFAALAAAGSLTGLLAMRAYKAIKSFLCKIMGDKRLPSAEAFVYEGCLFVDAAGNLWMMKRLKNKATSEITGAQFELIGHIERKQKNVKLPGKSGWKGLYIYT